MNRSVASLHAAFLMLSCGGATGLDAFAGGDSFSGSGGAAGAHPSPTDSGIVACPDPIGFYCLDSCAYLRHGDPVCSIGRWTCVSPTPQRSDLCGLSPPKPPTPPPAPPVTCPHDPPSTLEFRCCDAAGMDVTPECIAMDAPSFSCPSETNAVPKGVACGSGRGDGGADAGIDGAVAPCANTMTGYVAASALIDGESLLHVTPDGVFWDHITRAGPGMHNFQKLPTTISTSSEPAAHAWCPIWVNGCNTCDGTCGELREPMKSLPFAIKVFPGSIESTSFSCDGRERCVLQQAPSAQNGNEAIIDFDDVFTGGPANYSAILSFRYCVDAATSPPK